MERMLRTAHEAGKLREVHVADVFNHKANDGNRYIINLLALMSLCTSTTKSVTARCLGT